METKKDFDIGDLVWAKMKGFPFWPAEIVEPPAEARPTTPKKAHHYVFFFGSENYAWILDEHIVHHSEEMLQSTSTKKKSNSFKVALEKISEESRLAPKKIKSSAITKESPEASTSSVGRKINKVLKTKVTTETPRDSKKTTSKRRLEDSTSIRIPQKLSRKSEDYSELFSNTPPNLSYNRVAVIRPLDDVHTISANSQPAAGITQREFYELEDHPSLDLSKKDNIKLPNHVKVTDKKIGFIGLGMMGQRIVKNLIHTSHNVTVWNRSPEKCDAFKRVGAQVAQTPSDVVAECDIIFCCVSGADACKSLVFGNCGILSGLDKCTKPGSKGYVEMTTIDPTTSQEISEAIKHKGGRYLEAPVSGSRQIAEEGSLIILTAGDPDLFADCESCFLALSKHPYFLSEDVGSGSKLSVILSMLMGLSHAALAEAMALVERCSLQQTTFLEILKLVPLSSPLLLEKATAMIHRDFKTNSTLKYQQKDLKLALSLGNQHEQPLLLTAAANELFKHAKVLRYPNHDVSAVYLGVKY